MAELNSIKIADGIGPLNLKQGELFLEDFDGNDEIYQTYLTMIDLAKQWDSELTSELVNETLDLKIKNSD